MWNRLKRYVMLLRRFLAGGGYSRAEYLKKRGYFKSIGNHGNLEQNRI